MKKIYRRISLVLGVCILFVSAITTCFAKEGKAYAWYCAHVKGNQRPTAGELGFIADYRANYIGKDDKVIYLTFDAGYENGNVARILDTLKEEDVTGAFFVLGHLVRDNSELVKRMHDEGHLVCNHTYRHKDMSRVSSEAFEKELCDLENAYKDVTGAELDKFYRPPEGKFSEENLKEAQKLGYRTVFWSFGYADWDNAKQPNPDAAVRKIVSNFHNGEIMLLHPTSKTNADILGEVIRRAKAEGYRFGSLIELEEPCT